jgi:DNA-binding NarL/FixJ family response regulator
MKRVLIVDDAEQIRQRIVTLLTESSQIRIVGQAGNFQEAWEAVRRLNPDTVTLDIRLPGNSGIQLLKEIKAHYPKVTVIMLTNFDFAHYRQQCRKWGADYFLNKSLEFEKIVDAILASKKQ